MSSNYPLFDGDNLTMLVWLRTHFFVKEVNDYGRYDTKPTAGSTATDG